MTVTRTKTGRSVQPKTDDAVQTQLKSPSTASFTYNAANESRSITLAEILMLNAL